MMHRKFIATIVALSIGITAIGTAPARADNEDVARALAVILGIGILGAAINDRNDRRDEQATHRAHPHQPRAQRPRYQQPRVHHPRPRPLPQRVNRKLLPGGCLLSLERRNGQPVRMFGKLCLETHYLHAGSLPRDCKTRVKTYSGKRVGYEARCLRNRGYRIKRS